MLDFDLAEMYGTETKYLKRSVKRNIERFEGEDFMFELTKEELSMCNFGTLNEQTKNFKKKLMETKLVKVKITHEYGWEYALEDLIEELEAGEEPAMTINVDNDETFRLEASYQLVGPVLTCYFKDKEICLDILESFNFLCKAKVIRVDRVKDNAVIIIEVPLLAKTERENDSISCD